MRFVFSFSFSIPTVFSAIREVLDDLVFAGSSSSSELRFRLLDWCRVNGSMFSVSRWMSGVYFAVVVLAVGIPFF